MVAIPVPDFAKPYLSLVLAVWFTAVTLFKTAIFAVTHPSINIRYMKVRDVPPKCLTDPEYGEHKYIKVNGIKLHYVEKGDPNKPLMLFVHGFPEFWYSWRYQIKEFSKDYWTVAVDMRGYGYSDKPKDVKEYHIDKLANDLKELVLALGREKVTVVGHDWGACITWHFIASNMKMVDKYIVMDAPSMQMHQQKVWSSMDQFNKSWYMFFFQMPWVPECVYKMNDMTIVNILKGDKRHNTVTDEDIEAFKFILGQKDTFTCAINYYRANVRCAYKLKTPIQESEPAKGLFLMGEHDVYMSNDYGERMQKVFRNLEYKVVKGANHFIQQDDPVLVNQMMREFLQK